MIWVTWLAAIDSRTRLVFIANPNNPTGTWLGRAGLLRSWGRCRKKCLVVVDEAYLRVRGRTRIPGLFRVALSVS